MSVTIEGDTHADITSHDTYTSGPPHATFARLRAEDPVAWVDERDGRGFWAVTKYRDILVVSHEFGSYTSRLGIRLEEMTEEETAARRTLMEMDPPEHTRLRRLVAKVFNRQIVESYEDQIRALAVQVIERALEHDAFDFVEEIARELPMRMLGRLLGTPDEDGPRLVQLGDALLGNTDPEFTEHVVDLVDTEEFRLMPFRSPAGIELFQYAREQAALRRANPTDDVISKLLAPTTDGEPLTDLEFDNFFTLLVAAGNDTTRYTMAGALKALLDRPQLLDWLRGAGDDAWRVATDELLRWTSVTTHFRRTATHDIELRGRSIERGDKVVMFFISGNYDDDQFHAPYTLDLTRRPNDHMAFGRGGPHLCLGAWLARMEIRVTFQELVKRIAEIEQIAPEQYLRSNFISGIKHLPVRVTRR
jgi:cytochrome P450